MKYYNKLNGLAMTLYFMIRNRDKYNAELETQKLNILIYLAEIKSLDKLGTFVSFDKFVMMNNELTIPDISDIINGINLLQNKDKISLNDVSYIGKSKVDILNEIWIEHSNKDVNELLTYIHGNGVITAKDILIGLNKSELEINTILNHLKDVLPITVLNE